MEAVEAINSCMFIHDGQDEHADMLHATKILFIS